MEAKVVSRDSPKLLDRVRAEMRVRHYGIRTEETYLDWVRRFILFYDDDFTHVLSKGMVNPLGRQGKRYVCE